MAETSEPNGNDEPQGVEGNENASALEIEPEQADTNEAVPLNTAMTRLKGSADRDRKSVV